MGDDQWDLVLVELPRRDDAFRGGQQREGVLVQAFVAQATIGRSDEAVLRRLAGRDVVPLDAGVLAPGQDPTTGQFGALSLTIISGLPQRSTIAASSRTTRLPDSDVSTTLDNAAAITDIRSTDQAPPVTDVTDGAQHYCFVTVVAVDVAVPPTGALTVADVTCVATAA